MTSFIVLLWSSAGTCNESTMAENNPEFVLFQADGNIFVLVEELRYKIERTGQRIIVPAGFVTDFASVPQVAQSIISVLGKHSVPAVVHDYLYWVQTCTREQADNILYEAMQEYKANWFQKHAVYNAVRVGGAGAWTANEDDHKKGLPRILPVGNGPLPPNLNWQKYRQELYNRGVRAEPLANPGNRPAYCVLPE
jgi:hypothetical protein